ncbi:MAG: sugar phosphate isomerase/epimerase [Spirosomataceae bacterium]
MNHFVSRRDFLQQLSLLAGASLLSLEAEAKKANIQMGYSAITWGGKDDVAIKEIASLGFPGIQLRANTFGPYRNKVSELKDLIEANHLKLAMFSSGNIEVDPAKRQSTIDMHVAHASFVKALGGSAIQMTNSLRKGGVAPTTDELKQLTAVMNEVGKQTADLGVQAVYHNHMAQWGETPEEVDVIVNEMNPKYVKLLLDVAHYHQGGGKPADAVLKYKSIIHSLHIKDTMCPLPDKPNDPKAYRFVELGRGNVDLVAVFNNLRKINFKGWAVVELDGVPEKEKTPLQCAGISKQFLIEKAGIKL